MNYFFSDLVILSIHDLLPHEEINESKVLSIIGEIKGHQYLFAPVLVDKRSKIIIDGHHRYNALKNMGYKSVPCIECNYLSKKIVALKEGPNGRELDKKYVISLAKNGQLLPKKYTFHVYKNGDSYDHLSKIIRPISLDLSKIWETFICFINLLFRLIIFCL